MADDATIMSKLKNVALRCKWMPPLYTFLFLFFSVFVAEAIDTHQAIAGFYSDNYNDDEITQTELVEVVELHDGERLHQVIKHYRNNQRVKRDKPNRRINSTTFSTANVVTHIKSKLGNITTTYVRELTKKFTPSIPLLATNPTPNQTPSSVATPTLGVMVNHNWIDGWDFQPQTTVTVSVNGGDKGTKQATAGQDGYFWLEDWSGRDDGKRISVGDTVKATYDGDSVEMVVQDVTGSVDLENDRITGAALSPGGAPLKGRKVKVSVNEKWGENEPEIASGETTVSSDGSFSVKLSSFDLVKGQKIFLTLWDASDGSESGNRTMIEPYNAIPELGAAVNYKWIDGWNFLPHATVTVSINGVNKGTKQITMDQDGEFVIKDYDVSSGDAITATYDGGTVEMTVQDIKASVDWEGNRVTGTAFTPGGKPLKDRKVGAFVIEKLEKDTQELAESETVVSADGSFTITFSSFDVINEQNIVVILWDSEDGSERGNCTYFVITAATSAECETEKIGVSKSSLKLSGNESSEVIITITGKSDCPVEGEMINVTVNSSSKRCVSVTPANATTNDNGEATFMIIARDKTGRGIIKFLVGDLKKFITVKVRK